MKTAEKIYEHVKKLPEPVMREIFDFIEFVSRKKAHGPAGEPIGTDAAPHWPQIVLDYTGEPDFPPFEEGRDWRD